MKISLHVTSRDTLHHKYCSCSVVTKETNRESHFHYFVPGQHITEMEIEHMHVLEHNIKISTTAVQINTERICKPFKPFFTLLITSYCTLCRKDSLCALARRFCVSRKGGTGEMGGVTHRVLCTWQLVGLAIK